MRGQRANIGLKEKRGQQRKRGKERRGERIEI
jgi:hypothetical protein